MEFTADVTPEVARQRAIGIFLWINGFILLVFLVGFPVAVPLFMISYLTMQSRIGWLQSSGSDGRGLGVLLLSFPTAPQPAIRGRADSNLDGLVKCYWRPRLSCVTAVSN